MAKSYTITHNADGTTSVKKTNNDGSTSTSQGSNWSKDSSGEYTYSSSGSSSKKKKKSGSSSSSSVPGSDIDASWIGTNPISGLDKNETEAALETARNIASGSVGSRPTDNVFQNTYNDSKNKYIADQTNNANGYYRTGDILDDERLSEQDYWTIKNAQEAFNDAYSKNDPYGMAAANATVNALKKQYGYQEQYANKVISDALLANGAQWVDMRDSDGTFYDDGALVIDGKAYDPRTGQPVSTGTQVWNKDGTQSWVKNDIQFNGTPYINTNPTRTNNTLESLLGLEQGSLDLESAQTLARELGLNSLAEEQALNDQQAAALKVLRQEALDQLTNAQIDAIIRSGNEVQEQMQANAANEALSGGSEGAHAANTVAALLGNNQAISDSAQQYAEEMLGIQNQYDADIASGREAAYNRYVNNIMKAKEFAQGDVYNQAMLANIAATYRGQLASSNITAQAQVEAARLAAAAQAAASDKAAQAQLVAANLAAQAQTKSAELYNRPDYDNDPTTGNGVLPKNVLEYVETWGPKALLDLNKDPGLNKVYVDAYDAAMSKARMNDFAGYEEFLAYLEELTGWGPWNLVDTSIVDKSKGYYDAHGNIIKK